MIARIPGALFPYRLTFLGAPNEPEQCITPNHAIESAATMSSYIARLENGTVLPTMKTFFRVAKAAKPRAKFELEPVSAPPLTPQGPAEKAKWLDFRVS